MSEKKSQITKMQPVKFEFQNNGLSLFCLGKNR